MSFNYSIDWIHPDHHNLLTFLNFYLCSLLYYFGVFFLISNVLISVGLACRYLKVKFGPRIKPNREKAIMITGATAGIGLALAKHFYKLGFSVVAGYYNDQEPGYKELLECSGKPHESGRTKQGENILAPELFLVKMDVRSQESITNSAKEIFTLLEKNDIKLYCLINNAGISRDGPFEWCKRESLKDLIDTNLTGVMMVTREFILNIILNEGRIVNVSSGIFVTPGESISAYGSSKSAIAYFSASLNADIKKYGASTCCVIPGNFLATSSIIYPRVKCCQESIKSLTEKERTVYKRSIEEYSSSTNRLLELKLKSSGDDPNQVASLFRIDIPNFTTTRKRPNYFLRFIQWFVSITDGSPSIGETLEQSGILNGYEAAVCLKEPPQNIFAGNFFYSTFSGPWLEYLPRVLLGIITWLFTQGLKKN